MTDYILWILIAIVLILDFLVIVARASFNHARLPHLLNIGEGRMPAVDRTIKLMEKPGLQTSLRLAAVFSHLFLGGLAMIFFMRDGNRDLAWLNLLYLLIGFIFLNLIEFSLESWVLRSPEEKAIQFRSIGALISFLFSPLAALMVQILGPNVNKVSLAAMTEEDLKNWVEVGQPEGSLEKGEREMIYSIFQFGDTLAKEIMVPRIDVITLDINVTLGEAKATFERAGHSRVPVYEETVDNVVGLLYAKDLLNVNQDDERVADHRELLRIAYFVPEAKKVDELLAEMQARSMHMAVVVDEYGGVAGVVTLEDIVEEIIGEIRDEYDESEELPYTQIAENEFVFLGRVDLDLFNEVMNTDFMTENADTIGGLIYSEIGDVPEGGEKIQANGITLIVDQVVGRRITKVRAIRELVNTKVEDQEDVDG